MKISFMTFACPEWSFDQVVDAALRHGYHGIEFRCDAGHRHGVEVMTPDDERTAMRDRLERDGIEFCCLATSLQFADDRVLDQVPARVQLAADMGCPALRVFCGPRPETVREEDLARTVGLNLRAAADAAGESGVQFWLETHDTFCRAAAAAAAVRRADHPGVGINYDNMHPFRMGESIEESFAAISDLVRHSHFHDAMSKPDTVMIRPLGQGDLPVDEMFAALVASGFDGYLSGEWFNQMYGPTPDESLAKYREDMTTLAKRHGISIPSR